MAYELDDFNAFFEAGSGYGAGKILGDYFRVLFLWSI